MSAATGRILALIPAFNETARIESVVRGARRHLPVLVVDDGSADDTSARAAAAGAEVLRQEPNQGKGAALRAGYRRALEQGYDAVIMLDADGQHDPAEIPRFLEARAAQDADLVIGARQYGRMPPLRRVSNTIGRWILSAALGRYVPDNQSGYRLLSRRMMEAVLGSDERGFEFEVEMIATCIRGGYTLAWIPIRTIYAGEASHIRKLAHIRGFLRAAWRARRRG